MEKVLSSTRRRISRTKIYSSNSKDGMNQYFENVGIDSVEKKTVNIMDTNARLSKFTEDKKKDDRIRDWAVTGAYPINEHYLNQN